MVFINFQTKECPFCAETIQARAIKCRFCGEFLNTDKARAMEKKQAKASNTKPPAGEEPHNTADNVLFAARPSLWGITSTIIKGMCLIVLASLIIKYPIESLADKWLNLELTGNQISTFGTYRILTGIALGLIVALVLILKTVKLKMTYYEVSPDRIEWGRGILDRQVDNIDMYRVIDLKMRRNLLDCIVGIGSIGLTTTDKSDPKFEFQKIRRPRELYDIIKKASLEADRTTGVVHIE
ncbi:MAG: PH domain-containing protein [Sedimentisphaerales bacterium]|nr:PH domain-containing protein [Sedimentisphaerales bacterium]